MAVTPSGRGYWQVGADGGIFSFGDAAYYGSMGGQPLSQPIVGMAATPDGKGYWEVASDGGIFTFGDAGYYGSMGGQHLDQPIVGMAATPDGKGYWEVASDGGIFTFGDAAYYGSMGGAALAAPVMGMAATGSGHGYYEVGADGGIFTFGDAAFHGSAAGHSQAQIVGIAITPDGGGYWLASPRRRDLHLRGRGLLREHGGAEADKPRRERGVHARRRWLLAAAVHGASPTVERSASLAGRAVPPWPHCSSSCPTSVTGWVR